MFTREEAKWILAELEKNSAAMKKILGWTEANEPLRGPGPCVDCERVIGLLNVVTSRKGGQVFRLDKNGIREGLHTRHTMHGVEKCVQVVQVVGVRLASKHETYAFARPDTLFGTKNFEKYLEEVKGVPPPKEDPPAKFPRVSEADEIEAMTAPELRAEIDRIRAELKRLCRNPTKPGTQKHVSIRFLQAREEECEKRLEEVK
jgi:uncharacterized phage protein (TIGR02220 family)